MDQPIDLSLYKPTGLDLLSDMNLQPAVWHHKSQALVQQSLLLRRYPYVPKHWLERSHVLLDLGYPELALSDAWKAEHCCDVLLNQVACRPVSAWHLSRSNTVQDQEPDPAVSRDELLTLKAAIIEWQYQVTSQSDDQSVEYMTRPYPWLDAKHSQRANAVIDQINADLSLVQLTRPIGEKACAISRVDVSLPLVVKPSRAENSMDNWELGLFTKRQIEQGEVILEDRADLVGHNGNMKRHFVVEGHDMSWLYRYPHENFDRTILRLRCLAECIRDGVQHPLDHHLLARLKASHHCQQLHRLSIKEIAATNLALSQLGIDILVDHNFDAWVLFTIEARLDNNLWSEPNSSYLSPVFAMVNHSCEPNADRWHDRMRGTVVLTANKRIEAGEQVFVTYNAYMQHLPTASRRRLLRQWIDGDCMCTKCAAEATSPAKPCATSVDWQPPAAIDAFW